MRRHQRMLSVDDGGHEARDRCVGRPDRAVRGRRPDGGGSQSALAAAADIAEAGKELRLTIVALSSAHRTKAVAALCTELNKTPVPFPGTDLRLRYAVEDPR